MKALRYNLPLILIIFITAFTLCYGIYSAKGRMHFAVTLSGNLVTIWYYIVQKNERVVSSGMEKVQAAIFLAFILLLTASISLVLAFVIQALFINGIFRYQLASLSEISDFQMQILEANKSETKFILLCMVPFIVVTFLLIFKSAKLVEQRFFSRPWFLDLKYLLVFCLLIILILLSVIGIQSGLTSLCFILGSFALSLFIIQFLLIQRKKLPDSW